jgi:hypothetical protein
MFMCWRKEWQTKVCATWRVLSFQSVPDLISLSLLKQQPKIECLISRNFLVAGGRYRGRDDIAFDSANQDYYENSSTSSPIRLSFKR